MRIHLGHHFYGAGNLGDDFMLAGFLVAMESLAPDTTFTGSVPFPTDPLRRRFPQINWVPFDEVSRSRAIRDCDAWLGLGGSPFQCAQSRWFIDHLIVETNLCRQQRKPMFYLSVGSQSADELRHADVRAVCHQATAIWTRDVRTAEELGDSGIDAVQARADIAHVFFRSINRVLATPTPNQLTFVPNFDYADWRGSMIFSSAIDWLGVQRRIWLAQESRELLGAERALFKTLTPEHQAKWELAVPDQPGAALTTVMTRWPRTEWLVTSRYHAALAGAWAGSRIVVVTTNRKLEAAAQELSAPTLSPALSCTDIVQKCLEAQPQVQPKASADAAFRACQEFLSVARR